MSKPEKSKSGFVIKLSIETVQKLSEEDLINNKKIEKEPTDNLNPPKDVKAIKKVSTELENKTSLSEKEESTPIIVNEGHKKTGESVDSKISCDSEETTEKPESNTDSANSSWGDYAPYITYEGEESIYTDPSTQQKYTWSQSSNSWVAKTGVEVPGRAYSYENDTHIYTEADGSKSFWDPAKKAWLPMVDDDFLAFYQMSYGFVDNKTEEKKEEEDKSKEIQKKVDSQTGVKRKQEPQWFQPSDETNTKVYVSNLPEDMTEEEFVNFMQKCGLVERDPSSQKMKIKLYMDKEHNCFKGDALCTYIKIESVDLALNLLDGSDYKGNKIKVERAHFQLKGEYNPALKPKKKKKKELEKLKKMQQKLFDWRPEKIVGERSKHERVVIVKNLFHPTDFDKDVQLILDYQQDLREESTKCGEVRKVVMYDRHPEGVAQITMKEPEQADEVVKLINGRWFGKRQITAEIWDGRTKYRIAETDADISKRIDKWDKFLEGKEGQEKDSEDSKDQKTTESREVKTKNEVQDTKSAESKVKKDTNPNDDPQEVTNEVHLSLA